MPAVVYVEQALGAGLGASETAVAIGVAPPRWGAPIDLWQEKTGRRPRRPPTGQAARWGQILEPVVRGVYEATHGVECTVPRSSLYHPAKPWLRATPDGIVAEESRLVQVKCPGLRSAPDWGTDERRELPVYYHVQAAIEMAVTGLERCDFAVLLGGQEYFEITVHRDHDLEADLLEAAAAFWSCVETDTPPPLDGSAGWGMYLGTLLSAKSKRSVEASPDLDEAIGRWKEIRGALAELRAEESLIKNRIIEAAVKGEARRVTSSYGTIPIVEAQRASRNWEALARSIAKEAGVDVDAAIDSDTTRRTAPPYPRAPSGWAKEDDHGED